MPRLFLPLCGAALVLLQPAESFSFLGIASPFRLLDRLKPSSTRHLSDLLELYDVLQDPEFLESSEEWKSTFRDIVEGVEVTSEGVVEGKGLIAKRDFSEGEVVALYPIHALGYVNGRSPSRIHARSERVYGPYMPEAIRNKKERDAMMGTSDLVYFEDEYHVFGETEEDFPYAMTDPSDRYHFDVNPDRFLIRTPGEEATATAATTTTAHDTNHGLFLAHYVNDASFADFSPVVTASRELMREQRSFQRDGDGTRGAKSARNDEFARKGKELEDSAAQLAVEYLESTTGTNQNENDGTPTNKSEGLNAVMCAFGPPPLVAYVTTRPVRCGEEFLASYGLGYWLGKAFPEDDDATLDAALEALDAHPSMDVPQDRAHDVMEAALDVGELALRTTYGEHTKLVRDTLRDFQRRRRRQNRKQSWQRWRQKIVRRLGVAASNS